MSDYIMLGFAVVGVVAFIGGLIYCADQALNRSWTGEDDGKR